MKTHQISTNTFRGYDARPLKGFLMNCNNGGIASEMLRIGEKEGFKIFTVTRNACKESILTSEQEIQGIWAQDFWTILKDNVLFKKFTEETKNVLSRFKLPYNMVQKKLRESPECLELINAIYNKETEMIDKSNSPNCNFSELVKDTKNLKEMDKRLQEKLANFHISGGNVFIVKNGTKNELLVGETELDYLTPKEIMDLYSVDKITVIPQMDYHLDLFIRPLDNKRILLADDKKSLAVLKKAIQNLERYIETLEKEKLYTYIDWNNDLISFYNDFKKEAKLNTNPSTNTVEKILKKSGYEVIKVPGRVYHATYDPTSKETYLRHFCNYLNANVLINDNGELVYITNKSNLDDDLGLYLEEITNISFEDEFIKSISPYIKKEHIYFIEGENSYLPQEMLWLLKGGIHCACSEIPKEEVKNVKNTKSRK